jgi:hypothetical protein
MRAMVRRLLSREFTVGDVLEGLLYFTLAYVVIGLVVTFFHMPYVDMLAAQWERWMPGGAGLAAFVQITVMWPGLLLTTHLCMV